VRKVLSQDEGSLGILLAGYLALSVLVGISMAAVGLSLIAQNRIQAVADSAVLYAHDRSVKKGVPDVVRLRVNAASFLQLAPSAKELSVVGFQVSIANNESSLRLCARFADPLGIAPSSGEICKLAKAKSFRID
jgi:hypothetical protein